MLRALDRLHAELTRKGFRALNRVAVPAIKAGLGTPLPLGLGVEIGRAHV